MFPLLYVLRVLAQPSHPQKRSTRTLHDPVVSALDQQFPSLPESMHETWFSLDQPGTRFVSSADGAALVDVELSDSGAEPEFVAAQLTGTQKGVLSVLAGPFKRGYSWWQALHIFIRLLFAVVAFIPDQRVGTCTCMHACLLLHRLHVWTIDGRSACAGRGCWCAICGAAGLPATCAASWTARRKLLPGGPHDGCSAESQPRLGQL